MKKVAIITIISSNYGNRLQNYALEKTLEKLGCETSTLYPKPKYSLIKMLKNIIKDFIIVINSSKCEYRRREKSFKEFDKENISVSFCNKEMDKLVDEYDYFVCGSDQIWNVSFDFIDGYYFGDFVPGHKKIAYAASFGIDKIPDDKKDACSAWLYDFKDISVRELEGCKIVKELINREVPQMPDPTLLLKKDEWLELAKIKCEQKESVVVYFLGNISEDAKRLIDLVEQKYNLNIEYFSGVSKQSPQEFIASISKSRLVITDSFHACVFSIIMKVPFVVCDRTDDNLPMNSRINTLMNMFNLKNRKLSDVDFDNILNINYSQVDEILDEQRERAYKFLKKSLEIENEN